MTEDGAGLAHCPDLSRFYPGGGFGAGGRDGTPLASLASHLLDNIIRGPNLGETQRSSLRMTALRFSILARTPRWACWSSCL